MTHRTRAVAAPSDAGRTGLPSIAFLAVLALLIPAAAVAQVGSPAGAVPAPILTQRRAALLEAMDHGTAIIRSADPRSIEGDYPQDSDYRENNEFFYLTGLEAAGAFLVLRSSPGADGDVTLYLPPRSPREEQWTGERLGPGAEASRLTGIADVRSMETIMPELGGLIQKTGGTVYATLAPGGPCSGMALCAPALDELGLSVDHTEDVRPLVASLRLIKDADELVRLRRAIDITAEAQREAMRIVEPGMHEYELEAVIEFTFRRRGAERVGFPSIVGSGPNSVVLHYDKNRRRMEAGDLVVVDIGAEYGYYSADVTRTFPVSGTFTARQREIYNLVLGAQQAAMDAAKPGVTVADLNDVARKWIDDNSGSTCGGPSCNRYFVHGLSHWLGMDVHDVGDYSRPLEPDMVLTIEPGIYIASENIGVRIEDDILVTADGYELLSVGAPRSANEVERVLAERRQDK